MPSRCCVPGCKSNYDSYKKHQSNVSVFRFPKDIERRNRWLKCIRRENFIPNVCIHHFEEKFIIRQDTATRPDKSVLTVTRTKLKLSSDAIPTKFPNQSKYLSVELPTKGRDPTERAAAIEVFKQKKKMKKGHVNIVDKKESNDNSLHEAETSSSFPDHGEGSISTDSTDHPLGGYDRKKNQWKPTFFKYKLQTEYPLNVKLVEGPSTSKNRNTTYVPEVDIPTKIEIDELPLNTDEIKREYPEDEEESFSSKRFCTEDEFTLLGKEVETKVRQMRTEYGRRLVMQKIQAILHEAEAGMYDYPDSSSQENVMPVFVDCSKEVVDVSCVKEEVDETGESYGDNFDANN